VGLQLAFLLAGGPRPGHIIFRGQQNMPENSEGVPFCRPKLASWPITVMLARTYGGHNHVARRYQPMQSTGTDNAARTDRTLNVIQLDH